MSDRQVVLRRGRHVGWWVEGRAAGGRLLMKTWWPTQGASAAAFARNQLSILVLVAW